MTPLAHPLARRITTATPRGGMAPRRRGPCRPLLVVQAVVLVVHLGAAANLTTLAATPVPTKPAATSAPSAAGEAPAKLQVLPSAATSPTPPLGRAGPADLQQRLQRLQEQNRLCARCDCFALRRDGRNSSAAAVRVQLDENLDDVVVTTSHPRDATPATPPRPAVRPTVPPTSQVLVINCTERLLAEDLPRWSWPARLSAGEVVAAETWTEFRGGDLSGVSRLPHLPFRLTRLSLADNRLRSVASRAFAKLEALRDLDLSHNVITDVPFDAFLGLTALERLNLSRNSLTSRPLSADLFKQMPKLAVVSLAHNRIAGELNSDTLPWSGSIRQLDLSYNEITSVSAGAWRWLQNVKELDLSHNKLSSLTPDAFAGLRSLERLDLSWNALSSLPPGALSGLAALRTLSMAHNALQAPPADTFGPVQALAALDLSHNALNPGAFAVLAKLPASLRSLDLSHNPLGLGDGGLEGRADGGAALPSALEDLSLAECGLQSLEVRAWGGLHQLRHLQLSGNDISVLSDMAHMYALERLNVSRNSLTYFPTVRLAALRVLDVSHNQLEHAPAPEAPALSELLLDDNPIEQLRLAAAPSLAVLSASHMPVLRAVPAGAVVRLSSADRAANVTANVTATPPPCLSVTLRHNPALVDIGEGAFPASLCQLDLSHNALRWLPPRLANWTALRVLDLQANPWDCTCRLQWMLDDVVRQLYRSSPALLEDLRCASPMPVMGRRLVHWFNHTGRALCDGGIADIQSAGAVTLKLSPATLIVISALGAVLVMLVVLGVVAHRRDAAKRRARNRRL
ncbi:insulin-like growth factor-binding protein complex acid labile subunit [Thrips palmi]|uniref:Insulin-like growth factor-binding protein complex acid labile subunit n=1 Tax=Thrips palmi TaxID=161013 RepID=A0A6P8Z9Y5_THRPL|nr:insulin-like growth factor-binding protein complex acid labile subunit [Thrips palmi]